jgi:cytochrome c2
MKRRGTNLAMTLLLAAGCVALTAATAEADDAKSIERGKAVYKEQKCQMCHSIGEVGNKKGPLEGVGKRLTAEEIRQWIVDPKTMTEKTKAARKPMMKAYPTLPKEDLEALVAYMQSLK